MSTTASYGLGRHEDGCDCVRHRLGGSSPGAPGAPREPVLLNVYDLFWTNHVSSRLGMGVYHSGVQVYGREWSFGFHDLEVTGIYHHSPRDAGELGRKFRGERERWRCRDRPY